MIKIYTDGACSGNPGIGGWGVVIINEDNSTKFICGGEKNTTNNRMELEAAIQAVNYFSSSKDLEIFTDSKYLKNGIEDWILNWKNNGWKTSSKKSVKNKDKWIELDKCISDHNIKWNWVKGHANDIYNEKADELARKYIEKNT
ncbi:MAG: ribonuclease HI [Candidatus Marinimicrobia bacterium]|nr:ribonuclease HI [Candidatus Neomarinimicrobiota bacterium]|tara:strand:- start:12846 stop:13277 length:432 start_codon:yes stop_codon:yes gene_type:complete